MKSMNLDSNLLFGSLAVNTRYELPTGNKNYLSLYVGAADCVSGRAMVLRIEPKALPKTELPSVLERYSVSGTNGTDLIKVPNVSIMTLGNDYLYGVTHATTPTAIG